MDIRKINEFSNHLYCVRETKVKFSMLRHPFTVFNNSCILNMKIRYVLAILNLPYTPPFLSFVLLVQKHRMLLQNHIAVKTVTCALHSKTARTSTKVSMKTKVLFMGPVKIEIKNGYSEVIMLYQCEVILYAYDPLEQVQYVQITARYSYSVYFYS